MIRTTVLLLTVFIALSFAALWVLSGGLSRITDGAARFTNFFRSSTTTPKSESPGSRLPWQVPIPRGPEIEGYTGSEANNQPLEEEIVDIEAEIGTIESDVQRLKGTPNAY